MSDTRMQTILRRNLEEIRQKETSTKLLEDLNFLTDEERLVIRESEKENRGLDELIEIVSKSKNNSYFRNFIKILHRFNNTCEIALRIIEDPTIQQALLPPGLQRNRSDESPVGSVTPTPSPSTPYIFVSEETRNEKSRSWDDLTLNEEDRQCLGAVANGTSSNNTITQVDGGARLDSLPDKLFRKLALEISKDRDWEKLSDYMRLTRAETRPFVQSDNPAEMFLDYVSDKPVDAFFSCLDGAGLTDIRRKLPIRIVRERNQSTSLWSIENEYYTKLTEKLNKDKNWIKLANKMGLLVKDVCKLEWKVNPAKSLLDMHRGMKVEQLSDLLEKAGLANILTDLNTEGIRTTAASSQTIEYPNITTDATNQTTGAESSARNNQDETGSPVHDSLLRDETEGPRQANAIPSSERTYGNRSNVCDASCQTSICVEKAVITNPENNNEYDKTPEQNCTQLIRDAQEQLSNRPHVYRDIQNSFPSVENAIENVTTPEEEPKLEVPPETELAAFMEGAHAQNDIEAYSDIQNSAQSPDNFSNRFYNGITGNGAIISSPVGNESLKTPEQETAELITDANAQQGTYRDIQNSLPDIQR